MLEELDIASGLLQIALDRYLRVCSAIQKSFVTKSASNIISQDFTARIKTEVHTLLDYESKFQEAKAAITWARNSAALAPASSLPPEILTRVFRFVLSEERCSSREKDDHEENWFSQYPDRLSHVCSHWRWVALGSRDLWTHIDLYPEPIVNQQILPRAKAYGERSDPLPLYIHIDESAHTFGHGYVGRLPGPSDNPTANAIELVASLAPRTRSLNLTINGEYSDFHRKALESCLKNCVPGVLSRLVVCGAAGEDDYCRVITTRDGTLAREYHGEPYSSVPLDIPEQQIEDVLFRCTSLSLDGLFAPWESKAYRGLTELRLTRCNKSQFDSQDGSIPESVFVNMLKGSPQLRVLLFDLSMSAPLPDSTCVEPVALLILETLALGAEEEGSIGQFLRWIAPGPKPLAVLTQWVRDAGHRRTFEMGQFEAFLARSNVSRLSVAGAYSCDVTKLSQIAQRVPDLSLNDTEIDWDEIL
ncbi:unnamed protein product [Rhizoctonia solani]|uniref:F-box domain-containing protein n=1 Tax=Rhizoctonia solani TaxID=456999 RepID=A0A8H3BR92_9AGAM|nr:unnamed protein product [Rhizoctonia solani]